jgi:hypothetical protein
MENDKTQAKRGAEQERSSVATREARLKAQLRANLGRRKQAAQAGAEAEKADTKDNG